MSSNFTNSDEHIGQLLRDAFSDFERELLAGLHAAGAAEIRPSHNAILRFMDAEGTRASVLAQRSGLTRQAVGQIVDDLERLGYVAREPDPRDRRAKRVVYTDLGRAAFAASRDVIERIEREYARRLGRREWERLKRALRALPAG